MIFWGAQNIVGERSLKIPYSTIAVKHRVYLWILGLTLEPFLSSFMVVAGYNIEAFTRVFKPIVRLSLRNRWAFLTIAIFNATTLFLNSIAPLP